MDNLSFIGDDLHFRKTVEAGEKLLLVEKFVIFVIIVISVMFTQKILFMVNSFTWKSLRMVKKKLRKVLESFYTL